MPTSRSPAPRRPPRPARPRLSRERILDAAIALADREGLEALSMRRLGQELGVEAMSLYKHIDDKGDVLAGIADRIAAEFSLPASDKPWRSAIRASAIAAHQVLLRHPWAGPLLESSLSPGPARLAYLDAVIGVLRGGGFSLVDVAHAFGALDSHLYGFTMQVASWPFDADEMPGMAASLTAALPEDRYPNLVAMGTMVATSSAGVPLDFTFGLDLLLDGLERRLTSDDGRSAAAHVGLDRPDDEHDQRQRDQHEHDSDAHLHG